MFIWLLGISLESEDNLSKMLVVPDEVLSVTADPMISLVLDVVLGFLLYFFAIWWFWSSKEKKTWFFLGFFTWKVKNISYFSDKKTFWTFFVNFWIFFLGNFKFCLNSKSEIEKTMYFFFYNLILSYFELEVKNIPNCHIVIVLKEKNVLWFYQKNS